MATSRLTVCVQFMFEANILDSFTEVRRGFQFHDSRPNFYSLPLCVVNTTSTSLCSVVRLFHRIDRSSIMGQ